VAQFKAALRSLLQFRLILQHQSISPTLKLVSNLNTQVKVRDQDPIFNPGTLTLRMAQQVTVMNKTSKIGFLLTVSMRTDK